MAMFALPGALAAQVKQTNKIINFRLRDKYLIVVQTTVNGVGPFSFLLDTGATHTVIDPDLARQLQASVIGEASLTTVSDVRNDRLVRLKQVRVGDSEVSELGAIIDKLDDVKLKAPGIRGVLGEDFLSNFDFLIDYKARILRFG
ncbi:MAG: retropepsin-like aspartic protease, partial [Terracidiphilus sp.]